MKVAVEPAFKEPVDFSEQNRLVLCHRLAPQIVDCRPAESQHTDCSNRSVTDGSMRMSPSQRENEGMAEIFPYNYDYNS